MHPAIVEHGKLPRLIGPKPVRVSRTQLTLRSGQATLSATHGRRATDVGVNVAAVRANRRLTLLPISLSLHDLPVVRTRDAGSFRCRFSPGSADRGPIYPDRVRWATSAG